jgi:hypothetical protein
MFCHLLTILGLYGALDLEKNSIRTTMKKNSIRTTKSSNGTKKCIINYVEITSASVQVTGKGVQQWDGMRLALAGVI